MAGTALVGISGCSESDQLPTPLPDEDLVPPPVDASLDGASEASIASDSEAGSFGDGTADGAADAFQGSDGGATDAAYSDAGDL